MGIDSSKTFERTDAIEGRGKNVLKFGSKVGLQNEELNALFTLYYEHPVNPKTGCLNVHQYLAFNNATLSPISTLIFQILDVKKNNRLPFYDYLVLIWNFLTLNEYDMINFIFEIFDTTQRKVATIEEISLMVDLISGFAKDAINARAVNVLNLNKEGVQNKDGMVSVDEVRLLYKYHKFLFEPVFELQRNLRLRTINNFFWKRIQVRRYKLLHEGKRKHKLLGLCYNSVFDIVEGISREQVRLMVISNLRYTLSMDGIPVERLRVWESVQANKKPVRFIFPPELLNESNVMAQYDLPKEVPGEPSQSSPSGRLRIKTIHTPGYGSPLLKSEVFVSQEEKDLNRQGKIGRKKIERMFINFLTLQDRLLQRYYQHEKVDIFPLHPRPKELEKPDLVDRFPQLSVVTDGESTS